MDKAVIIYSTKTCGFCKATKEYLDSNNISYTDIDVGDNQDKAREMIEKSGQMGVPGIVVGEGQNEEVIVGFDQDRLAKAVGINE